MLQIPCGKKRLSADNVIILRRLPLLLQPTLRPSVGADESWRNLLRYSGEGEYLVCICDSEGYLA